MKGQGQEANRKYANSLTIRYSCPHFYQNNEAAIGKLFDWTLFQEIAKLV